MSQGFFFFNVNAALAFLSNYGACFKYANALVRMKGCGMESVLMSQ